MDEDKTLRKPSPDDVEKTMRKPSAANDDVEKTLRKPTASDDDTEKTLRKPSDAPVRETGGTEMDKTIAINRSNTAQEVPGMDDSVDKYILNGKTYNHKRIISESTGEGEIHLVEHKNDIFVLKLYFPQFKPKEELFKLLKSFNFPGVMKLYDYGVWTSPRGSKRSFEIMEYLEGGTLDEVFFVRNAAKLREIALQAASALAFCHNNQILHKDIKPGNFFFRDKKHTQLVLGDFGIASLCDEDELMHQTQQARTPIFAAPEMYETIDDKVEIDGKVDFYSLGILLMYIWLGDNPFKDKERKMVRMKRFGELPYPTDVPADILTLMQGLTIVDPAKRWGFEEVQKWYQGENVAVAKNTAARYKAFIFDADQNIVANNPQEMAQLMDKYPQLATKYLYSKRIVKWLEESGNTKLAVEIEEIVENRFPKNQQAGLRSTIYTLDENALYKSVDGVACDSFEKMAAAFLNNKAHYTKALKNNDDDFYLYLQAAGNTKERDLIQGFFKKHEATIALWKTIYYLDETTPFFLEIQKTKTKKDYIACTTPDEVIVAFRDNDITDDGWYSFTNGQLLAWYATRNDPDTLKKMEKIANDDSLDLSVQVHAILFYMNRQVAFTLYLPGENENQYYFTKEDIGNLLNNYACTVYQERKKDTFIDMCFKNLGSNKNIFYYYFESKNWTKENEWIKYCFELNSSENKKKAGPYNKEIALYKAIKGLGYDPYYYFSKSKKNVKSVEELSQINKDEVVKELEKGGLKNWLTVFYQEDPFVDLKPAYSFEKLSKQYLDKLEELNSNCAEAQRYREAVSLTGDLRKTVKIKFNAVRTMKIIFGVLFLVPSVLLLIALIMYKIPLTENPLPGAFWKVSSAYWFIATIVLGIWTWRVNGDGGLITNLVAGLIEAFILYYVIYLIVALLYPIVSIIAIVLVAAGILGFGWMAYGGISSSRALRKELFAGLDPETAFIEPLYHAFRPSRDGFESDQKEALEAYYEELKRQQKKLLSWIIPGILIFLVLAPAYYMLHPQFADHAIRRNILVSAGLVITNEQRNVIAGEWEGIFEDRPAILTIDSMRNDTVTGNLHVKYRRPVQEGFIGVYNYKEKTLNFGDTLVNNVLDGVYKATINETSDTIRGVYTNTKTNKEISFEFVRPLVEIEE